LARASRAAPHGSDALRSPLDAYRSPGAPAHVPAPPLRVGIMGTAAIAGKNRRAIVAGGATVAAVASRDLAKADPALAGEQVAKALGKLGSAAAGKAAGAAVAALGGATMAMVSGLVNSVEDAAKVSGIAHSKHGLGDLDSGARAAGKNRQTGGAAGRIRNRLVTQSPRPPH
jgi:hypothetical protein